MSGDGARVGGENEGGRGDGIERGVDPSEGCRGKKAFGEVQISDATRNRGGRAHPRLQMPLVKSKQTPAVLGRGGMTPLGGSSCEKRQLSPRLHVPRVKSKHMSASFASRRTDFFEALAAAMSAACSFLAFSLAFAPFISAYPLRNARGDGRGASGSARDRVGTPRGAGEGEGGKEKQRPAPAPRFTLTSHRLRSDPEPGRERLAP